MMMRGKIRNIEFAGLLKNEIRSVELFANADFVGSIAEVEGGLKQFSIRATKGGKQ
jgi:hypothetical protein